MAKKSTLAHRLPSTASLVETLAPPTIAATGRVGVPSAFSNARSSASMARPAACGSRPGNAATDAWARWAQEKASSTYRSPSFRQRRREAGIVIGFTVMKAQVLEQTDAILQQCAHRFSCHVTDAIFGERDRRAKRVAHKTGDRPQ